MSRENAAGIGRWQGAALAVSFVVGVGIIVLPTLAAEIAGAAGSLTAWLAMIVLAAPLIFVFAYLGRAHFREGGIAQYGVEGLGAWSRPAIRLSMLCALFAGIPAMIEVTAHLAASFLGLGDGATPFLAYAILAGLCVNNLRPIRKSTRISVVSLVVLLVVSLAVIVRNPAWVMKGAAILPHAFRPEADFKTILHAADLIFFGFIGWESMSLCTKDLRDPVRDSAFVYWASFGLVVLVYLGLALTVSGAVSAGARIDSLEGILSLLPRGPELFAAHLLCLIVLLANLNAWVLGGVEQIRSFTAGTGRGACAGRGFPVAAYGATAAILMTALHVGALTVSGLILFCNQNWIVLYGGVLVFAFRNARGARELAPLVAAVIAYFMLSRGFSALLLVNAAFFAGSLALRRLSRAGFIPILRSRSPAL